MKRVHHIGVLVQSIEDALPLYTELLGFSAEAPFELADQQVRVAFLRAGEDRIELLQPTTPTCPLAQVLAKRGEGLLHICLEVDEIEPTLSRLKAGGVRLVDEHAWTSPIGRVAFLHPKSFHGVSIELVQRIETAEPPTV